MSAAAAIASAVHLASLAGGVACLLLRRQALQQTLDDAGVKRVLTIDNWSGLVALTWIGSGLYRAFGGVEKGADFYTSNWLFWVKVGLVAVAMAFEWKPMMTFLRWRSQLAKNEPVDVSVAPSLVAHHLPEVALVGAVVVVATFMARGAGQMESNATASDLPPELAQGRAVYTSQCASCHQLDGRGNGGLTGADFAGDPTHLAKSDDELLAVIDKGVPGTAMLAFGDRLRPEDRKAVLAYVRHAFGPKPPPAADSASASPTPSAAPSVSPAPSAN